MCRRSNFSLHRRRIGARGPRLVSVARAVARPQFAQERFVRTAQVRTLVLGAAARCAHADDASARAPCLLGCPGGVRRGGLGGGKGVCLALGPRAGDECLRCMRCMRCAPVQRCRAICFALACWTPDGRVSNAIWFVPPGADNKPNLCLICVSALFLQAGQGRRESICPFRALALFRPVPWDGPHLGSAP